jgi:hypothetical protein
LMDESKFSVIQQMYELNAVFLFYGKHFHRRIFYEKGFERGRNGL